MFFDIRKRDTIFLCWLFHRPPLHVWHPPQGLGELRKSTFFVGGKNSTQPTRGARSAQIRLDSADPESQPTFSGTGTQPTDFSQIPQILRVHFRCMTSFTPPGNISYLGFYFDICEWRILPARAWTPALMLHLTYPCAKRKVLTNRKARYIIFTNPSARAGCDTRSIFKRSSTGLNSEFSFS